MRNRREVVPTTGLTRGKDRSDLRRDSFDCLLGEVETALRVNEGLSFAEQPPLTSGPASLNVAVKFHDYGEDGRRGPVEIKIDEDFHSRCGPSFLKITERINVSPDAGEKS